MTPLTASNLLALMAGVLLGVGIERGDWLMIGLGLFVGAACLAMFHCNPMNERE